MVVLHFWTKLTRHEIASGTMQNYQQTVKYNGFEYTIAEYAPNSYLYYIFLQKGKKVARTYFLKIQMYIELLYNGKVQKLIIEEKILEKYGIGANRLKSVAKLDEAGRFHIQLVEKLQENVRKIKHIGSIDVDKMNEIIGIEIV